MTITTWRITKATGANRAFDGEGARLHGGRWNSVGTPVVYLAENAALAILEMLVHIEFAAAMDLYVLIPVAFDPHLVRTLQKRNIPRDWSANPPKPTTQSIGDRWVAQGNDLLLSVPSALVPTERNYLLNPKHPDFSRLHIGAPQKFKFDPRFFTKAQSKKASP